MKFSSQIKSLTLGATVAAIAGIGMFSGSVQAAILTGTVSLGDLIAGNSYAINGTLFDNFRNFLSTSTGGADVITADDISITGQIDSALNTTLIFQSASLDVTGIQTINASFEYDATVTNPNPTPTTQFVFAGAGIDLSGAAVVPPGTITSTDTFTLPGGDTRTVSATLNPNSGPQAINFGVPGLRNISISKDLVLRGNGGVGEASISFLDQTTFQTVGEIPHNIPESSSVLGVLALGGLGLTLTAKKFKLKSTSMS